MSPGDPSEQQAGHLGSLPPVQCDACAAALRSGGRRAVSFLLLDQLTVPLIGCEEHLSQFASICEYTTEGAAELLEHRPAGGIGCPSCHLAPHNPRHPVVPVQDGAVVVLACPSHQSALVDRFQTGLDTRHQLSTHLETP